MVMLFRGQWVELGLLSCNCSMRSDITTSGVRLDSFHTHFVGMGRCTEIIGLIGSSPPLNSIIPRVSSTTMFPPHSIRVE